MISLYQAFSTIKNEREFGEFLRDLCTPTEIREMNARWKIAQMLWNAGNEKIKANPELATKKRAPKSKIGLTQMDIARMSKTGVATVTRVARCLYENSDNGYRTALKRLHPTSRHASAA